MSRACPSCDKQRRKRWTKSRLQDFLDESGSTLDVTEFENIATKVGFKCRVCGHEFSMRMAQTHMRIGVECPECRRIRGDEEGIKNKIQNSPDPLELVAYDPETRQATLRCRTCDSQWNEAANRSLDCFRCPTCCESRKRGEHARLSVEEYRKRLDERGHQEIEIVEYNGMRNPAVLKCSVCGHVWRVREAKHDFKGCPHCHRSTHPVSPELFRRKLDEAGGDYIKILSYTKTRNPAEFECAICGHKWAYTEASRILNFPSCPECKGTGEKVPFPSTLSQEEAQQRIDDSGKNIRILSYDKNSTPATFECLVCGHVWEEDNAFNIVNGIKAGCPECVASANHQADIEKWQDIVDERYDDIRVLDIGQNSISSITLQCKTCGEIWTTGRRNLLNENLRGTVLCQKCNPRFIPGMPLSKEAYLKILEKTSDGTFECLEFNGNNEKAKFHCFECGNIWYALASQVTTRRTGCPICRAQRSFPEESLYYYFSKELDEPVFCNPLLEFPNGRSFHPDVFIPGRLLIVEYDGLPWHKKPRVKKRDIIREETFTSSNIEVIHFVEDDDGEQRKNNFYSQEPYWIDTSHGGNAWRNELIASSLDDLFYVKNLPHDIIFDLNRDNQKIRKLWNQDRLLPQKVFKVIPDEKGGCSFIDISDELQEDLNESSSDEQEL